MALGNMLPLGEMQIVMKQEKRPCVIYDDMDNSWNVLWHMFYKDKALIEYDDGTTEWVNASSISFLDSKEQFEEYDFGEDI